MAKYGNVCVQCADCPTRLCSFDKAGLKIMVRRHYFLSHPFESSAETMERIK